MAQLTSNIDNLQTILETVNGLPEAGAGDASGQIAAHNNSTTAHPEIREMIGEKVSSLSYAPVSGNTTKIGTFFYTTDAEGDTDFDISIGSAEVLSALGNSGVSAGSYGPTGSASAGSTFNVPQVTVDQYGRVTKVVNRSVTLPSSGSGGDSGATNPYVLPTASYTELGGVKIGYTPSGKNYAVQLDENDKMYVNVPWTDNNTTYNNMTGATASSAGQAGLVPAPATGKQTSFLRGDGTWAIPTNTTYNDATTTTSGLMSAADKAKLNGINDEADSVSFSRNLTSGTKIGTLTINGSNTDLYCETNTDTQAVSSVFGRTGAVTLTKSDVTTALGYTPPTSDTNTHYTTRLYAGASGTVSNTATTDPYLKVTDDNTYRNQIRFVGSGGTTVSSDANGNITISSTSSSPSVATYNTFGIVKVDSSSLTVSGGVLSLSSTDIKNILGYVPANSANVPSAYTLPNATTTTKGGVIVGSNISVSSGTISLTKTNVTNALGYTPPTTNTTYTAGTGISISSANVISCTVSSSSYTLPTASASTLGGIKVGTGLAISSGVLSVSGYVPTTRTINDKALSANITLSRGDVGANKCYVQSSQPTSGMITGDIWIKT